jgi:putative membrane protein
MSLIKRISSRVEKMTASLRLQKVDPRLFWAKERTFLAWIRTGLALMGFGFVVARFNLFLRMIQTHGDTALPVLSGWSMWFGTVLVLMGVLVQILAVVDYTRFISMVKRGETPGLKPSTLGIVIASGLGLIGFVMAVYLIVNN